MWAHAEPTEILQNDQLRRLPRERKATAFTVAQIYVLPPLYHTQYNQLRLLSQL